MAAPNSKATLKEYALRQLGKPVIEINVDDDQVDDIIDDAYETLILDVFNGNTMLFSRSDFVEKAWEIVDPILNEINKNNIKLFGYKAGTWGPKKCDDLFRNQNTWRYPCKNLVNDGEICEL